MGSRLSVACCATVLAFLAFASPALAQQKTVKACEDEWRAKRAENQKAGITEKAYVEKCRAESAAAAPTTPMTTPTATTPSTTTATPTATGTKTVKSCEDEWRAKRAENQKAGITEKAYVEKCRAESAAATPTTPTTTPTTTTPPTTTTKAAPKEPAPAPTATKGPATNEPTTTPTTAPPPTTKAAKSPPPTTASAPTGANQFSSEASAKAHCPSDTVVWLNTSSKIFHFTGSNDYGKTKAGAYMCEKDSLAAGNRAAKNEKHP